MSLCSIERVLTIICLNDCIAVNALKIALIAKATDYLRLAGCKTV